MLPVKNQMLRKKPPFSGSLLTLSFTVKSFRLAFLDALKDLALFDLQYQSHLFCFLSHQSVTDIKIFSVVKATLPNFAVKVMFGYGITLKFYKL